MTVESKSWDPWRTMNEETQRLLPSEPETSTSLEKKIDTRTWTFYDLKVILNTQTESSQILTDLPPHEIVNLCDIPHGKLEFMVRYMLSVSEKV